MISVSYSLNSIHEGAVHITIPWLKLLVERKVKVDLAEKSDYDQPLVDDSVDSPEIKVEINPN